MSDILFIVLGIHCIIRGIMILLTGKLTRSEEAAARNYSANGLKRYKLLTAFMNLFGGLIISVVFLIKMLNLINGSLYRIVLLVLLVVMLIVYFAIRNTCKKI
jgi:cytochrome c oxidase subunit IV